MAEIPSILLPERTLIKQTQSGTASWRPDDKSDMKERWKGRYDWCLNVLSAFRYRHDSRQSGTLPNFATYDDFETVAGTLSSYWTPPPPQGDAWVLDNATIDECDGGNHGFLNLDWRLSSQVQISPKTPDVDVSDVDVWNLTWQSQQFDVYGFCANLSSTQSREYSQRSSIEAVFNIPAQYQNIKQQLAYMDSLGKIQQLNSHEQAIYRKKAEGVQPQYHYPALQNVHTWKELTKEGVVSVMGSSQWFRTPDQIVTVDAPFPSSFLSSFQWLYVGTEASVSQAQTPNGQKKSNQGKLFQVTLTLRFIGAKTWDVNFYGEAGQEGDIEKRWTLGKM